MTSLNDELALRAALDDLATGQPDAPVERLSSIRGRHVRRRRAQGIAAGVATAAIVVGTLFGAGAIGRTAAVEPAQHRHLPSWALQWPDHRDPTTSDALRKQAVAAWRSHTYGDVTDPFYAPRQVIWYLSAPVQNRGQVAVVFEVATDSGDKRLVAGYLSDPTTASQAGSWVLYDVAAPDLDRSPTGAWPVVSFYVPLLGSAGDNLVVLLTDPRGRQVHVAYASADSALNEGFAIVRTAHVTGRVEFSISDKSRRYPAGGYVGLAGNDDSKVPQLEQVPQLVAAGPGYVLGPLAGQGPSIEVDDTTPKSGLTQIVGQCYGGASIHVSLDADTPAQTVTIPCDDQQHAVPGPAWLSGTAMDVGTPGHNAHSVSVDAGKLVAWRIAVTSRGG